MTLPVLYSFRRCPYAIRARLALAQSGTRVTLREVVLKNKPAAMLEISPKGTVPVLQLPGGEVIDESIDVMRWALSQHDPGQWLAPSDSPREVEYLQLIERNDGEFKHWLDRYKYADRHPEHDPEHYRSQALAFVAELETRLQQTPYLMGERSSLADAAIWPFIRQFAHVDKAWFDSAPYPALQRWLNEFLDSQLFASVMKKYPQWQPEQAPIIFCC